MPDRSGQVLFIAGSRYPANGDAATVQMLIKRAKELKMQIVCGDARGIDTLVAREALKAGLKLTVLGIGKAPRAEFRASIRSLGVYKYVHHKTFGSFREQYFARDREMLLRADIACFVWNGKDQQGGTYTGYRNAKSEGKDFVLYSKGKILDTSF